MKMKLLNGVLTVILIFFVNSISAQVFRISTFSQQCMMSGDFAKKDINLNSAGYIDYGSSGGLELNYYFKNNLGLGLRWSGKNYMLDFDTYETDLKNMLGITNDQYDLTQSYGFWSMGSDFGLSYLVGLSQKLQLEPYFFFGFTGLLSPKTDIVYSQNGTTYQYITKSMIYFGYSYSPGVKLNWNIWKHFGLNFSVEYDGNTYLEDKERSLKYSYNMLEISDKEKSYKANSLNIGLGLAFRFGKGLNQ